MALALARKYRPKTFADVAVQSHVSATLKGAIARGRVAHGYLLCGPRGVGKTTLARVLAMALNCERRADPALDGEPCGECSTCQRIWAGSSSLDVVEIDAASNRGVDDARELRERAMYAPSGDGQYKVYIVDEAHMLTREAWNALLKILEEPPPRVVFVFATTEPQKIAQQAAPVLSRLQRFDFKRIGPADIRLRLEKVLGAEGVAAHPDALAMIARAADGSMRDALSLADQVLSMGDGAMTPDEVRDALGLVPEEEFLALLDLLAERRAGDVFAFVARLADAGIDFGQFLTGFADMVRAQLAVVLGGVPPEVSERAREGLVARRTAFAASDLLRMLQASTELEPRFRKSGQQQLLLESLLVRFALLDRTVSLEAVLRGLGGAGSGAHGESGSDAEQPMRRADAPVADWRTVVRDADRPLPATPPAATAPPAPKSASSKSGATTAAATNHGAVATAATGTAATGTAATATTATASAATASAATASAATATAATATAATATAATATVATATVATATVATATVATATVATATAMTTSAVNATAARTMTPVIASTALKGGAQRNDAPPDLNRLVEQWDELVRAMRATGKTVAATALEHASPITIDARGEVTIALDEANLIYEQALENVRGELLLLLQRSFSGVHRVRVRAAQLAATPPARLTDAMARTERLTALRRRDAVLGAAIDALDLELAD